MVPPLRPLVAALVLAIGVAGCANAPVSPDATPTSPLAPIPPEPPPPPPPPPPPKIAVTRFMAFGDSLTEGEVQPNTTIQAIEVEHAYPTVVLEALKSRYTTQTFTMANDGHGGCPANTDATPVDYCPPGQFESELQAAQPEVVLLLQGIVDLSFHRDDVGIENLAHAIRDYIRAAKAQNAHVFLSNLTAEKQPLPGFPPKDYADDALLAEANTAIANVAAAEGATLVDGYAATAADREHNVGGDGLHLTVQGYQALGQAFFEAIKLKYELPPDTTAASILSAHRSARR
jgi:lysophospholipase L1-like esterase